jgi:O6-methylguanine-DNA--protein-cysteine methyltransferase
VVLFIPTHRVIHADGRVGALLRQCPVVLFIPTHRVIHADGRVGGFAGQSWLKAKLLDLEGALTGSG